MSNFYSKWAISCYDTLICILAPLKLEKDKVLSGPLLYHILDKSREWNFSITWWWKEYARAPQMKRFQEIVMRCMHHLSSRPIRKLDFIINKFSTVNGMERITIRATSPHRNRYDHHSAINGWRTHSNFRAWAFGPLFLSRCPFERKMTIWSAPFVVGALDYKIITSWDG